jgi:hypothetical protein
MQQKPTAPAYPGNELAATLKPGLLKTGVFFPDETAFFEPRENLSSSSATSTPGSLPR